MGLLKCPESELVYVIYTAASTTYYNVRVSWWNDTWLVANYAALH